MNPRIFAVLATSSTLMIAGCSGPDISDTLERKLENPLFAEQFYDELVDAMVNLEIQNDPLSENPDTKRVIEESRVKGLANAKEATALQLQGRSGRFISDNNYSVGEVLLLGNTLYVGQTFNVLPGPDLHMYLSSVIDPRDEGITFPEEGSLDLGPIITPYGEHSYAIEATEEELDAMRTVVLWDKSFSRSYGFVQLQKAD